MKRLTNQEKDIIEAMRNFREAKSRMQFQMDFYLDVIERVENYLFGKGD